MFSFQENAFSSLATIPEGTDGTRTRISLLVGTAEWAQSVRGLGFEPRKLVGTAEWALWASEVQRRSNASDLLSDDLPSVDTPRKPSVARELQKAWPNLALAGLFVKYA